MTTTSSSINNLPRKVFVVSRCCVCAQPLTDEASVTTGMGPVCRARANELLARELPSTMHSVEAQGLLLSLSSAVIDDPEVQVRLNRVQELFSSPDRRRAVSEAAALLNRVPEAIAASLCSLMVHAGYRVYLMYILNQVASGEGNTLSLANNLLVFKGVRNASGNNAFRGVGARWNREVEGWVVPATDAQKVNAFCNVVADFWPFTKGLTTQIAAAKTAAAAIAPVVAAPAAPATSSLAACLLTLQDGHILFTAPRYNAGAVSAIKALVGRRFWPEHLSPSGKPAWSVPATQQASLEAVAKQFFNLQ